jgi:hypothetical protein
MPKGAIAAGSTGAYWKYAMLLIAILHFMPDAEDPATIVALRRGLPDGGSWLALSCGTTNFRSAPKTCEIGIYAGVAAKT